MELFMSCKIVAKNDQQKVVKSTSSHGLMCNLNLPNAPHFGRVFEVMIKAAKRATSAILGNADVTDEELSCAFDKCPVSSAFIGAEALLNLTQLTYRSASPNDITPLIPSHFLHGELGSSTVSPVPTDTVRHPKQHWRCVQELIRHFWHHWIQQWLRSLASRKKMETVESKFRCRWYCFGDEHWNPQRDMAIGENCICSPWQRWTCACRESPSGTRPVTALCPIECTE